MPMICPECGKKLRKNEIFCPECGMAGELEDESKKNRKSTIDKKIYDYLKQEFKDVYAVGYDNVESIDIFAEKNSTSKDRLTRWIKDSASLVLKDKKAFLSVEMMPNVNTTPIAVAGNVLIHSIGDSALVRFNRKNEVEYSLSDKEFPRYLLIVIPDPDEGVASNKKDQMEIIEHSIKEMKFLENSSLKDFRICLMKDFEAEIKDLLNE
jgi:uncharacterized Zn finger protein (UPF0148 family)